MLNRVLVVSALLSCVACGGSSTSPTPSAPFSQTDLVVGTGATAVAGSRVTVAYSLWLYDPAGPNGKGSALQSAPSFTFILGTGAVIPGWDQGVPGMRVGGQRRLVIPPNLAYGSAGSGPIPPNATLVFEITLISIG